MFFSEIEKLRLEIAELKLSKTEVTEAVELSNDNIEVLSHNPDATTEVKLNKISTKRQMTTQDVVMAKLFN
jgi:DNA-binding Xre family transcriptional regulator